MKPLFSRRGIVQHQGPQRAVQPGGFGAEGRGWRRIPRQRHALDEEALRRLAKEHVRAGESRYELVIGLAAQVHVAGPARLPIGEAVEPPLQAVYPRWIARGILRAVVAVVPIQNIKAPV